jgi:hypothetical protein
MRAGITAGFGVGAHSAFYRAGEEGSGQEVGSQEAADGKCDFNGAGVMVLKRQRGGETGSRGGSGKEEAERRPVPCGGGRRRTAAHGTVAPTKGGGGSGVTEEGERPRVGRLGLDWAALAGL